MSRYAKQIANAERLIKRFGQVVQWQKRAADINETQPWKETVPSTNGVPDDVIEYDVSIVFCRPNGGLSEALTHLIKGTDVPTGAPRGLMASVSFTPEITDCVVRDGSTLMIKAIDPVAPDGEAIIYDIQFA